MSKIILPKNLAKYSQKWIALYKGKQVIAAGNSFEEVVKKIPGKEEKATIFKIPPAGVFSP